MKYLTAIICAAIVGGAIIYHARTRPGRYYFPLDYKMGVWACDTATGEIYFLTESKGFDARNPARECFKWPWE
ncbi:MAG: hypothetical protein H8E62_03730 [Planctomycetes bacterium]|nr:hypothetical protein [Planctomycetota bacterium]